MAGKQLDLFGGDADWSAESWTSSDDRVRGGKSQSYLDCPSASEAVFHGHLDITTLGGAGFASQRTLDDQEPWDLTDYDGLLLHVKKSDGKKYTLILKDEVLPKRPDGREQSSVSWEYDFACAEETLFIPWDDLKPTYRGKPKPDAEPLDLENIKRVSIMMRSFFGRQQGDFRLEIGSIAAAAKHRSEGKQREPPQSAAGAEPSAPETGNTAPKSFWLRWFRNTS